MKVGISTACTPNVTRELFDSFARAGIDAAEISMASARYPVFPYRAAVRWAKDAGVSLWSFHLPFAPFEAYNIASIDEGGRKNAIRLLHEYIQKAGSMGIGRIVIHPSGEPIAPSDRPMAMAAAKESLATLAELSWREGAVLCVEDLPRTCLGNCSREILELLSVDDRLRVCFDTNHLLGEPIPDFIRAVGNKIETLHISDYEFTDERHWLPGEGDIDWCTLYRLLCEAGYDGVFLYELSFKGNPKSIRRPRPLVPEDYRQNADEIFAMRQPTPFGTRCENLKGFLG